MSDELRDICRTLENRYVHEERTIEPSFYNDLSEDLVAKFTAIGFDCLLSLDEQICSVFIFEFYKTLHLDRDQKNHLLIQFTINNHRFNISLAQYAELTSLPNQGICIYSDSWGLDELEKILEQIKPYNSRLLAIDDIRNLMHQRTIHEKFIQKNSPNFERKTARMSVKYPAYVNLTSSSEEQPNKRTHLPPPRKKFLSPTEVPSKSISSKSTHYTSSSSPSESPTPTHVATPPKLYFVIPIKQKPQELPPLQMSLKNPYVSTMDNWP
nr:hypothetical protein [Tanacetum cinerariifolium]